MAGLCEGGNELSGSLKAIFIQINYIDGTTSACKHGMTCMSLKDCAVHIKNQQNHEVDVFFVCGGQQVCCPHQQSIPTQPIQENTANHVNMRLLPLDKCGGSFDDKITGGQNASLGQFPWMALLGARLSNGSLLFICGGTLINDRYVLTAAHCLQQPHAIVSLPSKEILRGHSDSSFRGEGYIQCCVGVRLCDMYSNQELAEIHFMYGKADGNAALARRLYQERYPQRQCPDRKTFVRLHYRLCEYGKFNSMDREKVRLGEHNLDTNMDCDPYDDYCADPVQDYEIEEAISHEEFNLNHTQQRFKNDIALIRLKSKVHNYTSYIQPICLPFDIEITGREEKKYQIAGWGKTDFYESGGSPVLQFATVINVPIDECNNLQAKEVRNLTEKQLCSEGNRGEDPCKGDSGGPLMEVISKGRIIQVGIVSFGPIPCANAPSVYSRVSAYLDWILDHISE
ncbi:hypothetical protein ANN_16753 [Periplaneta americana]|uniref:Peptidase S1 domain-containing protein n=1 Tax=Periplaneta americana TaxID=6978 RepID=A0ABQ8SSE7_PERAM|nr:hypothetical protein ANN_16753 [Periplaneta americana]